MGKLAKSFERWHGTERSISQSLLRSSVSIALLALILSIAAAEVLVYEPARRSAAAAELGGAADRVAAQLRTVVQRAEAVSRLRRDWGSNGLIDFAHVGNLVRLLNPLFERGPNVSSIAIANDSGPEILLVRDSAGRASTRFTDPERLHGKAIVKTWQPNGVPISEESRDSDYDARRRPWFKGAHAMRSPDGVYWTEPFVYRFTQVPGISAVVRWTAPDGQSYTSTTDITLLDISRFTREQVVGRSGFATVFTPDGRVIGLPRDKRFSSDLELKSSVLQQVTTLGVPALSEGYARWRSSGGATEHAERFEVSGKTWLGTFRRIALGDSILWVGAFAPEADFAISGTTQLITLVLIVLGTLGLSWMATRRIAFRFAQPLQALAAESERIGRLDLDRPVRVTSAWREIEATARAQELMRTNLLQATRGLEDEVGRRTAELLQARDAANAGARAKAAFLANMSHEIRTPLNAISGLTQLMLRTSMSPMQRDYLSKIEDATTMLLHIVNDVLDYSKIDAGKLVIEQTEFLLDEVLRRVTQIVAATAEQKGLELIIGRSPSVPAVLVGDPIRLEQVLVNLASNAVKFTSTGEVFLRVDSAEDDQGRALLRFVVRDTGIGMTPDQIRGLFQSFSQADESMARRFGGSGLGLAISKRLVELMGGEIKVESAPSVGSTFSFTIGLQPAADGSDLRARGAHALAGMRALVIDDNKTALLALADALRCFGVDVDTADHGPAAIDAFSAALRRAQPYQLVLVDRHMREMDGFQVVRAMRQKCPDLAGLFMMVTATERALLAEQLAAERLAGCVIKPATPSSLLDAVLTGIGASRPLLQDEDAATTSVAPGHRVLVVEDNEVNRLVAVEMLKGLGVQASTACSGPEALARVASGERFDLIFMDVQMAGMDGLQATRALRALPEGARMSIVALTAHAMPEDRAQCIAAGMNDYMSKPMSQEALAKCVQRWLPSKDLGAPRATFST